MASSAKPAFSKEQTRSVSKEQTRSVSGLSCEAWMPADQFEYCQILSEPPDGSSSWVLAGMYPE